MSQIDSILLQQDHTLLTVHYEADCVLSGDTSLPLHAPSWIFELCQPAWHDDGDGVSHGHGHCHDNDEGDADE